MSDKRKQKKDLFTEKRRKAWNREKQAQMPVNVRVKAIGCFCRGALSLMFDGILNATLSEKVSITGVTQENLELRLLPNSLCSHQAHNHEMKFWTDPVFLLP